MNTVPLISGLLDNVQNPLVMQFVAKILSQASFSAALRMDTLLQLLQSSEDVITMGLKEIASRVSTKKVSKWNNDKNKWLRNISEEHKNQLLKFY